MIHTIDANKQTIGRVAAKAASLLMGKNVTSYAKNKVTLVTVKITNASKLSISQKKRDTKTYARYSGYPGGLVKEPLPQLSARKGYAELLKLAIYGMLPSNKLRPQMLKHLIITE